ncbi:hypothetical protein JB92DRAFT_2904767 [Gautieria morchelliformis]|nr:hypothetical protein JB92DRAFT_2904767 [Gautieria morchelliformis]
MRQPVAYPCVPLSLSSSLSFFLLRGLLELCTFTLEFPDDSFPRGHRSSAGDAMLVMPELQAVTLTGHHLLFDILSHLTLPSLRHFRLRETGKSSQTPTIGNCFLEMIARSLPPVETLELHGIDVTDSDFIRCFMYLPTLVELLLHDSEISNEVFRQLISPSLGDDTSNSLFCPQLKRLDLRWCSQLSGKVLVELVERRLTSSQTHSISEVVVINCSFVREDDVLALAAMTHCRLKNRNEDFCYHRGCCTNSRYRHRFMLRHGGDVRQELKGGCRLES